MKILVIGDGKIGSALRKALWGAGHHVIATSRKGAGDVNLELLNISELPSVDAIYFCAAVTRFIDCEDDRDAYSINVDAPIHIAKQCRGSLTSFIYLSSEAVERALHTNYGMMKALAEIGLRAVYNPVIARLSKVTPETMEACCAFLIGLLGKPPGVYKWQ